MRLLVIGGSGLIGSHILRESSRLGLHVTGTYHGRQEPGLLQLDTGDAHGFESLVETHSPDAVVHCAGFTWADGCENDPERAAELNCRQPAKMAEFCQRRGIRFCYFSSSYVFDGSAGPYGESSMPNPINVYGRTKLEAETALARITGGTALLLRVICVYGVEARRKNFACQVCDAMLSGREMSIPSDQLGNPTWAGDIARTTVDLLKNQASGPFHLGGADPNCDRLRWARRLVEIFREVGIRPSHGFGLVGKPTIELNQKAKRPLHGGVVSRRLPFRTFEPEDEISICRAIAQGGGEP